MNCPACGHENPDGARFCNECAGPLPLRCLKCGSPNPPGSKFCNECAAPLTGASSPLIRPQDTLSEIRVAPEQPQASLDGERKMVTALFADIKGSMELMEDLDPEERPRNCRSRTEADDGRGASLWRLCGAIDRRWHLRIVRCASGTRRPSAARAICRTQIAGRDAPLLGKAARCWKPAPRSPRWSEYRGGSGPFDCDGRRS